MTSLVTVKNLSDVKLTGVKLSWLKEDSTIMSVTLTDVDGNSVTIAGTDAYSKSVKVLVKEPPKTEQRYRLNGDYHGIKISQVFEAEHEAERANNQLFMGALTIEAVEVNVDDKGNVIKSLDIDDDLPF